MPRKQQVTEYPVKRRLDNNSSERCRWVSVLARPDSVSSSAPQREPSCNFGCGAAPFSVGVRGLLNNLCNADGFLAAALFARPKRKRNRNAAGLVTSPSCRSARKSGDWRMGARTLESKRWFSSEFSGQRVASRCYMRHTSRSLSDACAKTDDLKMRNLASVCACRGSSAMELTSDGVVVY